MYSFTDHPSRVCMTFLTHFRLSLYLSSLFFKASCQAFVHGFFPFYFASSSTINCKRIHKIIESSGCKGKKEN